MPWTERQHALLQEMGIRLWSEPLREEPLREDVAVAEVASVAEATESAEVSAVPAWVEEAALPVRAVASVVPAAVVRAPARDVVALGPRPSGVDAMDWLALREAVADCRACSLCQGRRKTVFGVGHPQAHWMIIGEAPGEQEDQQGEPFVGKAGQLLDRMLAALGLSREWAADATADPQADAAAQRVFIANVLKCRPPNNRNPEPSEVAQCEPFLKRQVALVQPKIILAMGRFAVQSLLQTQDPIGRLRGRVHRYEGVPVVVTYHPAYLLRNPLDKARSWEDLCLAAAVMASSEA